MASVPLQLSKIITGLMDLQYWQNREVKDKPVSGAQRSARPAIWDVLHPAVCSIIVSTNGRPIAAIKR